MTVENLDLVTERSGRVPDLPDLSGEDVQVRGSDRTWIHVDRSFTFETFEGCVLIKGEFQFLPIQYLSQHHIMSSMLEASEAFLQFVVLAEEVRDDEEQRPVVHRRQDLIGDLDQVARFIDGLRTEGPDDRPPLLPLVGSPDLTTEGPGEGADADSIPLLEAEMCECRTDGGCMVELGPHPPLIGSPRATPPGLGAE